MAVDLTPGGRALERLFDRTRGRIEPGLDRTRALLTALNHPERAYPSFHVAGTNGKGSTCAAIDALLRAGGRRVGRFASPHLIDPRERFLLDGAPIPSDDVEALLARIEPEADRVGATFFEITTALALAWFAECEVDVAVVETGLGGRLDSTNVLDPVVATVTNVSMDHMEYLGDTIEAIAAEKAGIFKAERPAVIGEPDARIAELLATRAREHGASPIVSVRDEWRPERVEVIAGATHVSARTPRGDMRFVTPLLGEHQAWNALTALATVAAAPGFTLPADLDSALEKAFVPGRFQRAGAWVFDVAHNTAGARALARTMAAASLPRPVTLLLAVLRDKEWESVVRTLATAADEIVLTTPPTAPASRAWDPTAAATVAREVAADVVVEPDFDRALSRVGRRGGTRVVAGSFHTVGDAMQRLGIDPLAPQVARTESAAP